MKKFGTCVTVTGAFDMVHSLQLQLHIRCIQLHSMRLQLHSIQWQVHSLQLHSMRDTCTFDVGTIRFTDARAMQVQFHILCSNFGFVGSSQRDPVGSLQKILADTAHMYTYTHTH